MPENIFTTVNKIKYYYHAKKREIICNFFEFMSNHDASERHHYNNPKTTLSFSNYIDQNYLKDISKKEDVLLFLQSKIKVKEQDLEQKWITTCNEYLYRIKYFYIWLYNGNEHGIESSIDQWTTPKFIESLKPKKTKRWNPY